MRKVLLALTAIVLAVVLWLPAAAQAAFGIAPGSLHVVAEYQGGAPDQQAGSHPFGFAVSFSFNHDSGNNAEGSARDAVVTLPPGLIGNVASLPRCSHVSFEGSQAHCPGDTQIGTFSAIFKGGGETLSVGGPVYNLAPLSGAAASFGFAVAGFVTVENATLVKREGAYQVQVTTNNIAHSYLREISETIWGEPTDSRHDAERTCIDSATGHFFSDCPSTAAHEAFLSLPSSCTGPLMTTLEADSAEEPGLFDSQSAETPGLGNCEALPFNPTIQAAPTSKLAENPSGLDFELKMPDFGLTDPGGIAETEAEKAEVTLPEGVTVNPAQAEGIGICTEAQIDLEGEAEPHCPEASKIGSVEVHTPLLEEPLTGSLYLAQPYQNPSHTLLALYMTFRAPERGILVKLAGKVEPDPRTGQLITTFEDLPQLPFSDFKLHFREGGRAPLITPPLCGTYTTIARFTPWSDLEETRTVTSPFQIERGVNGGACPSGGTPPFHPAFEAGSLNNAAGSYSPFDLKLTRADGEQEITKFSTTLPPGMVGKIAGVSKCPQASIEAAKGLTGTQEQQSPSCPAASQIGTTLAGAGVGGTLLYVPGKLYLGGAYHGDPLSVVAIVPAVAGPFDVGDVVVQEALTLNPVTAEVEVDGSASDPIPHILAGIPLRVRDIRVYANRPNFTLNPTSCAPLASKATLWGAGNDVFSSADDVPVSLSSRFQAADCASLGFRPKLKINLKGGTKRGRFPAVKAEVNPRPGDANFAKAVVTLPHSAFLEQGHFATICTRVQFAAGAGNGAACPAASIYGKAKATSPLLEEPLEGPVFLRSSDHNLPDLVVALHGLVNVDLDARIDSIHGGIRTHFEGIPDAPVSRFVLEMQGGAKGLIVNSTNICVGAHKADAQLSGQNGRLDEFEPAVTASGCAKGRKHKRGGSGPA
jgi:hypothetical protein